MQPMRAEVARDVNVAGTRYQADPDEIVEVAPGHVAILAGYGFVPADEESTDLEDRNLGELRELAAQANIRGRTKMHREELLEALRETEPQEA